MAGLQETRIAGWEDSRIAGRAGQGDKQDSRQQHGKIAGQGDKQDGKTRRQTGWTAWKGHGGVVSVLALPRQQLKDSKTPRFMDTQPLSYNCIPIGYETSRGSSTRRH